jgi:hypothetical protein
MRVGMGRLMRIVVMLVVVVTMPVIMAMAMLVPVVPEFGFVEQKEKHQAHQQGQKQLVRPGLALEGFRQQMQE